MISSSGALAAKRRVGYRPRSKLSEIREVICSGPAAPTTATRMPGRTPIIRVALRTLATATAHSPRVPLDPPVPITR